MVRRKQEDIWGWGVPALKRVGVAWVKYLRKRREERERGKRKEEYC